MDWAYTAEKGTHWTGTCKEVEAEEDQEQLGRKVKRRSKTWQNKMKLKYGHRMNGVHWQHTVYTCAPPRSSHDGVSNR